MRKPRDIDAELKALAEKTKLLKERRVHQLGELVIATGADSTDAETLAGALLVIAETTDPAKRESWRKRGSAPSHDNILFGTSGSQTVPTTLKPWRRSATIISASP